VSRRPLIDLHAEIRAGERRWSEFQEGQKAMMSRLAAEPVIVPPPRTPGTTPAELAAEIEDVRRRRLEPVGILAGRREWKRLKEMDGARDHLVHWFGTDETFAGVPIILRRGARGVQLFTELPDLDAACRELPQPLGPLQRRR
jgi:hypothetical protein